MSGCSLSLNPSPGQKEKHQARWKLPPRGPQLRLGSKILQHTGHRREVVWNRAEACCQTHDRQGQSNLCSVYFPSGDPSNMLPPPSLWGLPSHRVLCEDEEAPTSCCPGSPLASALGLLTPPASARRFQEAEGRAGEGRELFCTGGGPCFFHPYQRGREKPQEGIPREEVIPFSSTQREGASCLRHAALQLPGWQGHSETRCPHLPALKVLTTASGLVKAHLCLQVLLVRAGDTHLWAPPWPGTLTFGARTLPVLSPSFSGQDKEAPISPCPKVTEPGVPPVACCPLSPFLP